MLPEWFRWQPSQYINAHTASTNAYNNNSNNGDNVMHKTANDDAVAVDADVLLCVPWHHYHRRHLKVVG